VEWNGEVPCCKRLRKQRARAYWKWKTAQTIQPFFYQRFLLSGQKVAIFTFTNPADQKMALLAGSLDICGTTLAHAIYSASRGQPVVVVAALCNKCSALVVRRESHIRNPRDLAGKKIGSGEPFPTMAVVKGFGRILSYPYFGGTIGTINAGMLVRRNTIQADAARARF